MRALLDNQRSAFEKLKNLKVGALFLGCGCGKTQTAVSLINTVDDVDLLLWVCPLQTKENVKSELEKCECRYTPYIVGVESIGQSDRVYMEVLNKVQAAKNVFIVVDESLKIKNWKAKRTQRLYKIGEYAQFKLILNGTPITKNIIDIFTQMKFLSPKILRNMSFYQFKDNYCIYKQWKKQGRVEKEVITGYTNLDHLLSIIDPYIYQCTLDIGLDQHYRTVHWETTPAEYSRYQEYKRELFLDSSDKDGGLLAMIQELHHFYCCFENKFEVIEGLINDRTLIYCKFLRSKAELKKRFPGVRVMTYGTGSLGLNLQDYNRIIYFDKTFDYAFREQSEARIYRTGQQDDCEYYDLTGDIGLEDMIDRCIKRKTNLVNEFKGISREGFLKKIEKIEKRKKYKKLTDSTCKR